jgi:hypothetical protein
MQQTGESFNELDASSIYLDMIVKLIFTDAFCKIESEVCEKLSSILYFICRHIGNTATPHGSKEKTALHLGDKLVRLTTLYQVFNSILFLAPRISLIANDHEALIR